jgi:hypothetical protein
LTLPVVLILAPFSLIATGGRSWLVWLTSGALGLAIFGYLDWVSRGWFSFYTFDIVTSHGRAIDYFIFWKKLLPVLLPALILSIYYGFIVIKKSRINPFSLPTRMWVNLGLGAALIITSWSIYLKTWTYDNAMMMACLGIALLSGLALVEIYRDHIPTEANPPNLTAWRAGATVLLLLQFLLLVYNPAKQLPTQADRANAQAFIERLKGLSGEALVFNHGFMSYQAGKTSYLHSAPYSDMVSGFDWHATSETQQRKALVKDTLDRAFQDQIFEWVILDQPERNWTPYYVYVEDLATEPGVFYPVTGVKTRPESLLIKNPIPTGGILPLQDGRYDSFFVNGWSEPQQWGRWVEEEQAMVHIALIEGDYLLKIDLKPACMDGQPAGRRLQIGWNEHAYFETELGGCDLRSYMVSLPEKKIANGLNDLWLQITPADQSTAGTALSPGMPLAGIYAIEFIQN